MPKAILICDLQFGSTGKGLLAGYIAHRWLPDAIVTGWGPNAGHTFVDYFGKAHVRTMIGCGTVAKSVKDVFIGPGSVINPVNLKREIKEADLTERKIRLHIHANAAVVLDHHRAAERENLNRIGSTQKGTGAAMIEKIWRKEDNNTAGFALAGTSLGEYTVQPDDYSYRLATCQRILIEGSQGFSLSIHHGLYPYVTSRDVTPAQILADTGVPVPWLSKVIGTMRVHPIRVANRYDEKGEQVGYSGPGYPDQKEITWEELDQTPELTTVTRLPRRVFTFSPAQFMHAVTVCRPDEIFLNFINYLNQHDTKIFMGRVKELAKIHKTKIRYLGHGPTETDIEDFFPGEVL